MVSDWACGGQWNRMVQFLSSLLQAIEHGNIELAVVFNGTLESCRMSQWTEEQANIRQRVGMVLKHINTKATPPPKVWWMPPTCLRTVLRMAFRHLSTSLVRILILRCTFLKSACLRLSVTLQVVARKEIELNSG